MTAEEVDDVVLGGASAVEGVAAPAPGVTTTEGQPRPCVRSHSSVTADCGVGGWDCCGVCTPIAGDALPSDSSRVCAPNGVHGIEPPGDAADAPETDDEIERLCACGVMEGGCIGGSGDSGLFAFDAAGAAA